MLHPRGGQRFLPRAVLVPLSAEDRPVSMRAAATSTLRRLIPRGGPKYLQRAVLVRVSAEDRTVSIRAAATSLYRKMCSMSEQHI